MPTLPTTHEALADLVRRFTDAFNRDDLDAVMAYFTDAAVYDQFNGVRAVGKAAIRDAFGPQFRGDFGTIRFLTDDLFVDAATGKAMISWRCTLTRDGTTRGWRGLDLLHFDGHFIKVKSTYAKADTPKLELVA